MTTNHKTALITGVTGQDGAYLAGLDIGAIRHDLLQLLFVLVAALIEDTARSIR